MKPQGNLSPYNGVKRIIFFSVVYFLLCGLIPLAAFDADSTIIHNAEISPLPLRVDVNGNTISITKADLDRLGSTVNPGPAYIGPGGDSLKAIQLGSVIPLMLDIWSFHCTVYGGESISLPADGCADNLFNMYLIAEGSQWTLLDGDRIIHDISGITIKGDILTRKDLEVWVSWEGTEELKEIIAEYAETFSIDITVNSIPNTSTKLVAHNRGNMMIPDVVMVKSDYLPQLLSEEAVQPIGWEVPDTFQEQGTASFTSDKLYGVPFYSDVQVLCYNPEIIPQIYGWNNSELSGTLEDLEKILSGLPDDVIPSTWNIYSAYWLLPFILSFGKEQILEPDNSIKVNDQPTIDAVNYLIHLMDTGVASAVERDGMISQFIRGKVGMIMTGSYSIPSFSDLGIPFEISVYPINQETGSYVSPLIDYKGFAIPRKSRNPIGARRLIQYLTSQTVQAEFCFGQFKNPVREEAWELSPLDAHMETILRESIARGKIIPPEPAYIIAKDTLWKMLRMMLDKQIPVITGLEKAQEIITNKLSRIED